jgi:hypothetical protein
MSIRPTALTLHAAASAAGLGALGLLLLRP